jgi:hypothetical protein
LAYVKLNETIVNICIVGYSRKNTLLLKNAKKKKKKKKKNRIEVINIHTFRNYH